MRRTINLLGWICVFFTIISIVLTLLTTYQFTYVKYFNGYYTLQWSMFFTMIIWAVKLFDYKSTFMSKLYPIVCTIIAAGALFFIFMKVN